MRLAAAWIALLLVSAPALAGSEEDPEVDDGSSDDSVSTNPGLGAGAADIRKAWVQQDAEAFTVTIQLGSAACSDPTETIEYRGEMAGVSFGVDLFGTGPGFCSAGGSATTVTPTGEASGGEISGNLVIIRVPREAFGNPADGTALEGLYVTSRAYVGDPNAWNDSDRAPDEGGGRAYVVGGTQEPTVTVTNVTEDVLRVAVNQTTPLSETRVYVWNMTGEIAFRAQGHAAGVANITIGETPHCLCTDAFNESAVLALNGTTNITISFEQFNGTLEFVGALHVEPEPSQTPEPEESTDAPAPTNSTPPEIVDEPTPAQESPLPLAVMLLALVVAARRR